ncbi:tripartite tricarboxylate transporter substrate binding protein [Ramlibacter agri]|nr:tripartite tricarboxylate transporter substrate binding protein [Ramlibacter agri]
MIARMLKKYFAAAVAAAFSLASLAAHADTWPSKTIRFVVPFGPGGANDLVARYVAEAASRELGATIIVDNKPGAGSVLGSEIVARSAPDGYTFLAPAGGVITNAMIKKAMPYKEDDLVPVIMMAVSPSVIVVPADSPIKDLKGLVEASKKKGLNFSTAGTGSTPHFVAEMLKLKGGANLTIVPYKSGNEGVVAVMGKQVDATSEASPVVLPQIKGGKLRPLASTWNRRVAALQDIPTAEELGFKDLVIGHWAGLFAPKGTPVEILDKMNAAVNKALKNSELRAKLIPQGIDPQGGSREDFRRYLAAEKARLGPVAKAANMQAD